MKRRHLIEAAAITALCPSAFAASGDLGMSPYGPVKRAYVEHPTIVRQSCPLFCWAASVAMIFKYYDHPVSQTAIARRIFGHSACRPSGNPANIIAALTADWTDDNGEDFSAEVGALADVYNGVSNLTNADIVDELENDHPLIYGNLSHCMVLVSMDYAETPAGPQPLRAGVLDPLPSSPAFHALTVPEMYLAPRGQLALLATVRIDD